MSKYVAVILCSTYSDVHVEDLEICDSVDEAESFLYDFLSDSWDEFMPDTKQTFDKKIDFAAFSEQMKNVVLTYENRYKLDWIRVDD